MTAPGNDQPALLWPTMKAWLDGRRGRGEISDRTYANYSYYANRFAQHIGPDRPLASITTDDIETWLGSLTNKDRQHRELICNNSKNTYLATVRSFFGWATQRRLIDYNPCLVIRKAKVGARPVKRLQPEQVTAVLAASGPRDQALIILGVQMMLRVGELEQLRVEDWDRTLGTLLARGKGDKHRLLPLTAEATEALSEWVGDRTEGPMWPNRYTGEPMLRDGLRQAITAAGKRAGVKLTPHMLRHTGASDAAAAGASLPALRDFLGHESLATTSRYTWSTRAELKAAVDGRRYRPARPACRAATVAVEPSLVADFT